MKAKRKSTKIKIPEPLPITPNVIFTTGNVTISVANLANWSVTVDPSIGLAQVTGVSDFVLKETA